MPSTSEIGAIRPRAGMDAAVQQAVVTDSILELRLPTTRMEAGVFGHGGQTDR